MFKLRRIKTLGASLLTAWFFLTGPSVNKAQKWQQYVDVEKAGWSSSELEGARQYAASIGSSAVMIVDQGNVVASWGHTKHPYKAASMRKSIYDGIIGSTDLRKSLNLNTSIKQLGIDDLDPLSEQENRATFEQLMTARSGVYHPAAYETQSNAKRRPKRNSAAPGEKWYYNNWDFNLVAVTYKKLSGFSIKNGFKKGIAEPLGMEDYESSHVFDWLEPRVSRHPATTFRISARDLARFGKLYLQKGKWNNTQIISPEWIKRSTTPHTTFEEGHYRGSGNGYGRMWWIFPARPKSSSAYEAHHRIAALGAGGHIMVLFPELDLLIVHRADTDSGRGVTDQDAAKLMDMILGARKGTPSRFAALGPVREEKLTDKEPKPLRNDYLAVSKKLRDKLIGRFMFSEKTGMKLYEFGNRLFLQPVGMPLTDAEVFEVTDGSLRSPLTDLVIEPIESDSKTIDSVKLSFRGQTMLAKRIK